MQHVLNKRSSYLILISIDSKENKIKMYSKITQIILLIKQTMFPSKIVIIKITIC